MMVDGFAYIGSGLGSPGGSHYKLSDFGGLIREKPSTKRDLSFLK